MSSVGGAGHAGHGAPAALDTESPRGAAPETPAAADPHAAHRAGSGTTATPVRPTERLKVDLSTRPREARVGKPVRLAFDIRGADGRPARLATVHEKKVHTIVVSNDLSEFQHIHPVRGADKYVVDYTPAKAGGHTVFAEMTPEGRDAKTALERFDLDVAGRSLPVPLKVDLEPKTVKNLDVSLELEPKTVRAGKPVKLSFALRDPATGRAPDKMEKFLGAKGHAVATNVDRDGLIHAHPLDEAMPGMPGLPGMGGDAAASHVRHAVEQRARRGPADAPAAATRIEFEATFPKPGLYKVWGQFRRDGKDVVAPFVVEVKGRS